MGKHRVRQHIVSQAYLKRFAQKNVNNSGANIAVYQKKRTHYLLVPSRELLLKKIIMI